jgi:LDH2 family malate/lactate/ureidoglycolate dehydrogenase
VDSDGIGVLPRYVEWTLAGFIHPEAETERLRRTQGIPVAPALVRQCNEIAAGLGVKPLA